MKLRISSAALLAGLLAFGCGPTAPPLACPEGATVQRVQYAESEGSGHGERCLRPDGTRHGPSRDWYADGTLRSLTSWVNGERHGASTLWHPNGVKQAQAEHSHWMPIGVWINWDDEGNVVDQKDFGAGPEVSSAPAS